MSSGSSAPDLGGRIVSRWLTKLGKQGDVTGASKQNCEHDP